MEVVFERTASCQFSLQLASETLEGAVGKGLNTDYLYPFYTMWIVFAFCP